MVKRKRKARASHTNPCAANHPPEERRSKRRRIVKIIDEDEEELDAGHADDIGPDNEVDKIGAADQGASAGNGSTDVGRKDGQLGGKSRAGGNEIAGNGGRDGAEAIESGSEASSKGDNLDTANVFEIAADGDGPCDKDVDESGAAGEEVARERDGSEVETVSLETITYPDDFLTRGWSSTAFKYELLLGHRLLVNYYDIYHASMPRFVNEVVLNVASDRILRNRDCTTEAGWIWIHETDLIAAVLAGQDVARNFPIPRMEQILSSSVLFVPMHTHASMHWSLLVIVIMKSLLDSVLRVKPQARGGLHPAELSEEQPRPFALHFDSFRSSGHKSLCQKVLRMFSNYLSDAWKRKYMDEWRLTNFSLFVRPFVSSSLKVVSAKVEEQEDAHTCGWRILDGLQFITERKDTVLENITPISEEDVRSDYAAIAARTIRCLKEQCTSSVPDTPLLLYRAHLLLDEMCCSAFDANPSNVNDVMVSFFDVKEKEKGNGGANRKKILRKQNYEDLFSAAASEMENRNLMSRMRGKKRSPIPQK